MTDADQGLDALLERARRAGPADRIGWRDPIAAHGVAAIDAVTPWLEDSTLVAFAIRVIARAGANGEQEAARQTLRRARARMGAHLRADVDWALRQLQGRDGVPVPGPTSARAVRRSEAPLYSARSVVRQRRRTVGEIAATRSRGAG